MGLSILVVDDSKLARMVVEGILARSRPDWRMIEAASALEAVNLLQAERVDIMLVDYNMPDTDGLDLAAKVRGEHPHVLLAVVSANAQDAIKLRTRELGAIFIEKPLTDEGLLRFLSGAELTLRHLGK